jgi:hypothetical protein
MAFADVYLVSTDLLLATLSEIEALEQELAIKVPPGYTEFMTTLGFGEYCYNLVVYPPQQILSEYRAAQASWQDYYFWEDSADVLTKEEIIQSIIFGQSFDGDKIIFCPAKPSQLFVLPRHDLDIYSIPSNFFEPLEWYDSQNNRVYSPINFKFFTPYQNRSFLTFSNPQENVEVAALTKILYEFFTDSAIPQFQPYGSVLMLFMASIGGQIHISIRDPEEKYASSIQIQYASDHFKEIEALTEKLVALNFSVREQATYSYE